MIFDLLSADAERHGGLEIERECARVQGNEAFKFTCWWFSSVMKTGLADERGIRGAQLFATAFTERKELNRHVALERQKQE
jgi:hypothetical protein